MRERLQYWWTRDLDGSDLEALLQAMEFWYSEVIDVHFGKEARELYGREVVEAARDTLEALREEYEARHGK